MSATLWIVSKGKSWRTKDAAKQRKAERSANHRAGRHKEPREKNWKRLYVRSNKLARARQLGFEYPRKSKREIIDEHLTDELDDQSQ